MGPLNGVKVIEFAGIGPGLLLMTFFAIYSVAVNWHRRLPTWDLAELGAEIDRARALRAKEAAEERMRGEHDAEVEAALSRAHARLAASGGLTGTAAGAH